MSPTTVHFLLYSLWPNHIDIIKEGHLYQFQSYQTYYQEEGHTQVEEYDAVAGRAQHLYEVVHLCVVDDHEVVHDINHDIDVHLQNMINNDITICFLKRKCI